MGRRQDTGHCRGPVNNPFSLLTPPPFCLVHPAQPEHPDAAAFGVQDATDDRQVSGIGWHGVRGMILGGTM